MWTLFQCRWACALWYKVNQSQASQDIRDDVNGRFLPDWESLQHLFHWTRPLEGFEESWLWFHIRLQWNEGKTCSEMQHKRKRERKQNLVDKDTQDWKEKNDANQMMIVWTKNVSPQDWIPRDNLSEYWLQNYRKFNKQERRIDLLLQYQKVVKQDL